MRRDARPAVRCPFCIDMDATGTCRSSFARREIVRPPGPDDIALVLHTSGSTGRPKRVPLDAREPVPSRAERGAQLRAGTRRRVAVRDAAVPRARARGFDARDALDGGTVSRSKFNPLSFWRVARDYDVTWYSAVPTLHQLLLARAKPARRPNRPARSVCGSSVSCSAALPPQVMHELEAASVRRCSRPMG